MMTLRTPIIFILLCCLQGDRFALNLVPSHGQLLLRLCQDTIITRGIKRTIFLCFSLKKKKKKKKQEKKKEENMKIKTSRLLDMPN